MSSSALRMRPRPAQTPDTKAAAIVADLRRLKILSARATQQIENSLVGGCATSEELGEILREGGLTDFQTQVALAGQTSRLVFAGFVLLDKVGEGGMGVVYRALQPRIGRVEALKVIRTDKVGSATTVKRFLREIQLTSSLEHPYVVRAYDAGEVDEQLYLATEFVNGTDLATVVGGGGPLALADAALIAYQTTLALQHIHEKGLVHRDLKPSNLMWDPAAATVKLLDLGLSGFNQSGLDAGAAGAPLNRNGVVLGTPDFMAPEQVQDPHGVDIRADLYSLGCTLYFLLTGELPFNGSPVEKMYSHGYTPPPPLVLPGGAAPPPGLSELIGRLMAKKPADRFQAPQDLLAALLATCPEVAGRLTGTSTPPQLVAIPVPAPPAGPGSGAFDHLLSAHDSVADALPVHPPGPAQPQGPGPGKGRFSWLWIAATAAAMFVSGFAGAALYLALFAK